jgi:hydroxypyruvate isomerase
MVNTKSRRSFITSSLAAGAAFFAAPALLSGRNRAGMFTNAAKPFRMGYAPSVGMFRDLCGSDDPVDNIKFCHDTGFRAVFDNDFPGRPAGEQERIATEVQRFGMMMGPWVLYADFSKTSFVLNHSEVRSFLKTKMEEGIEVARRSGFTTMLMVPGRYDERLHPDYQRSNVIENLKYCAELAEPEGVTIVIEPLNTLRDHPGMYLTAMPQAFQICEAVGSPSVKIVDDLYHQQITEGNLIPNIDACWDQIAAFHVGDNPGRNEPTSGEINFRNIFKHLYERGYKGVICMEHGRSIKGNEGAIKVIDAYRECDSF